MFCSLETGVPEALLDIVVDGKIEQAITFKVPPKKVEKIVNKSVNPIDIFLGSVKMTL